MTEPTTTISVRGEARHVVPPDYAVISTSVRSRNREKDVALERAGTAQAAVVTALRERGGQPLTVESIDAALTWSTRSFSADHIRVLDRQKQEHFRAWRVQVPVTVTVRDLAQLDDVARVLAQVASLRIQYVRWGVDPRNSAWPVVRAAAIADAVSKARDYARALGGEVSALVHVADEGMLGRPERYGMRDQGIALSSSGAEAGGGFGGPSLDPAPQEITAAIEARFEATVAAL